MLLTGLKSLVDNCYTAGQNRLSSFRKVASIASVANSVIDFSMAPGNPRPNFYTGLELTSTPFTSEYGIWSGGNVSPQTKYLKSISLQSAVAGIVPCELYVLDYLMFYPLIDMDNTDEQIFTNSITLPRYPDGFGIKAFLVATNPYIGGASFTINYTNHKGESGRKSRLIATNTNTYIGSIVHAGGNIVQGLSGIFIDLPNSEGIRSVESISFISPNGGLATLVLCKVLTNVYIREITAPAEWDLLLMKGELPIIKDGAYINFIGQVGGNVAGSPLFGLVETIFN